MITKLSNGLDAKATLPEVVEKIRTGLGLNLLEVDLVKLVIKCPKGLSIIEQAEQTAKRKDVNQPNN